MRSETILSVSHLKQHFQINKDFIIKAVDGVSFQIEKGEVFGLVGETGSGKSTIARTIMGIYPATQGEVCFKGNKISDKKVYHKYKNDIHKNMQIIFQDSAAALNPRMTVEEIIIEPIIVNKLIKDKKEIQKKVASLLLEVGLDDTDKNKYPTEISGGQRQRVAIARCLSTSPDLIIADEPIASLDVSIQAQIITLFQKLQREHGFSFLLIAHDLSIIKFICDKVGVMLNGRIMEIGPTEEVFSNPTHPYTQSLLSAMPVPDPIYERNKVLINYDVRSAIKEAEMVELSPKHSVLNNFQSLVV
ncbi:ATP-binding cassette domain-containing protein [Acetobacterium woodii]|uniref:Oligopeptide ABC transport system ATP-binding protein OppF1 n=1 Tax=Acetobacterium woodii (strain ATCC 29683 / DSM 1030 / JCM 2381 / KCTC 1655 / WB1) TaxID=931626 RepID=H6LEC3_ACEWD|nr:ABC transporter ATP-binding protein [Acetobacterium woodii]AFA46837.1 oligopeptide ABC transport system ATP-binding protein OppF1 [Acetobacterium woodii DSM 1030]